MSECVPKTLACRACVSGPSKPPSVGGSVDPMFGGGWSFPGACNTCLRRKAHRKNPPPKSKSSSKQVSLNNFCWVPDSCHREACRSLREIFKNLHVNAVFLLVFLDFGVGFLASNFDSKLRRLPEVSGAVLVIPPNQRLTYALRRVGTALKVHEMSILQQQQQNLCECF